MLYQTRNPHGGDIYGGQVVLDYSANTNPYGTPQGVLDAVAAALPRVHQYPDPYCRRLVRAIADHEGVPESYVLCGNGAAELIYGFARAVQPRYAAELAPTFSEYALALEQNGCRVVRYFLKEEDGFSPDEGFLTFLSKEKPEAVFLCNPNNPTGKRIAPALLRNVLEICREKGIRLFLDECFMDMTGEDGSLVPLLAEYPQLLILKAFTKSYGMAGIRLGYCLSSDKGLLKAMSECCQPWNVSTLAQEAGIAALKEDVFLQKTVETVKTERAWLTGHLKDCGFRVCEGEANYILFRAPVGLDTQLKARGIAIRSCANYHGLEAGWYRIAVRLRNQNEALMEAIRQVLEGE